MACARVPETANCSRALGLLLAEEVRDADAVAQMEQAASLRRRTPAFSTIWD